MFDLERFHRGGHRFFRELIRDHGPLVLAVARGFAEDFDHAEDLFQAIWSQAYRKRASFRGESCFQAWLHRLAINLCLTDRRARRRRSNAHERMAQLVQRDETIWVAPNPSQEIERKELSEKFHHALAHLSHREHEAIILRIFERRETSEVAQMMGVKESSVRSSLRHGIKRLRETMEDPGDELPRCESSH